MRASNIERNKRIVELYLSGKSSIEIGKLVDLSDDQVRYVLKQNGVTIRPQPFLDLTGKVFGRLTVLSFYDSYRQTRRWLCKCECGKEKVLRCDHLTGNRVISCGCYKSEITAKRQTTHGQSVRGHFTLEFKMYHGAKNRAKKENLPFDIDLNDIYIPESCPVLGIPLFKGEGIITDNSPTLDKLIPELGYTKGNICVISNRANKIKTDATYKEIIAVADWLKRELHVSNVFKQLSID